jgi:hypothetical protein
VGLHDEGWQARIRHVRAAPSRTLRLYPSTSILMRVGTFASTTLSRVRTRTGTVLIDLARCLDMILGVLVVGEAEGAGRVRRPPCHAQTLATSH